MLEIPISRLRKAPWNYKKDDKELAAKLKANIRRNGQLENIVVREIEPGIFEIVNGNHRHDAMKDLGFETVTCANLGEIDLDSAKRVAVELNETRFESDSQRLSELMVGLVGRFGKEDVLDTSPFNKMILDTMTDPSLFLPPSDPNSSSEPLGDGFGGRQASDLPLPFTFTLRFHERDLIDWMSHLKMLRAGYGTERNEEALLALVRSFAPTCSNEVAGFQKIVGLLPPDTLQNLKLVERNVAERLEEDGRGLAEDPHIRLGQIVEVLCAEYLASFGS
jgi:hypothetical protein